MDFLNGVFVGTVATVILNGAISLWLERRREQRAVRAAARLLDHEFSSSAMYVDLVLDAGYWWEAGDFAFDHEAWREHKALMATALSFTGWHHVTYAKRCIRQFELARESAIP